MPARLELQHLKKFFNTHGGMLHAVDDVSMKIETGATMGVVGESGCGKSTLGRLIAHLHESTSGRIIYDGKDVTILKKEGLRDLRQKVQMIFQDPFSSLNPRKSIYQIISEPLMLLGKYDKGRIEEETYRVMDLVGIEERIRHAYPHELDGGRRQRVGIGRALALNPKFIVCDEPVSALDVSIQAQILNLLQDLQEQKNLTYMFITHDLSVVKHISNNISVMYLGQLVETSPSAALFRKPLHPYTKALLAAVPSTNIDNPRKRELIRGELTSPVNPKPGCRFYARCPFAGQACKEPQVLSEIEKEHFVSCCRAEHINA
jgi:oligopeptide/dipeptide ABC transporter ATP-binding protein